MDIIKKFSYSKAVEDNRLLEGGINCIYEMDFYFKLIISVLSVFFYIFFLIKYKNKYLKLNNTNSKKKLKYNFILKIFGIWGILNELLVFFYKSYTYKAIYILNPCHINLILSSLLLLDIIEDKNKLIFNICLSNIFGLSGGILFPDYSGMEYLFERILFDLEHYLAIINWYLINFYNYDYYKSLNNIFNYHYGYSFFLLYHRVILWPLSELTWTNWNYTICGNTSDPFYLMWNKYYYLFSEIYVPAGMYFFRFMYFFLFQILLYLKNIFSKLVNLKNKKYN